MVSLTLLPHSLAYAEMRLILARMLWNFDLELQPDSQDWTSQKVCSHVRGFERVLLTCCRFGFSGKRFRSTLSSYPVGYKSKMIVSCLWNDSIYLAMTDLWDGGKRSQIFSKACIFNRSIVQSFNHFK